MICRFLRSPHLFPEPFKNLSPAPYDYHKKHDSASNQGDLDPVSECTCCTLPIPFQCVLWLCNKISAILWTAWILSHNEVKNLAPAGGWSLRAQELPQSPVSLLQFSVQIQCSRLCYDLLALLLPLQPTIHKVCLKIWSLPCSSPYHGFPSCLE